MDLEVELQGEDGSKFALGKEDNVVFGRGCGFNTHDRTVSRRHVSFQLEQSESEHARVSFQVIGRNPIWVWTHDSLRLFRKFDNGHLQFGDRFCLSPEAPFWFLFKKIQSQPQLKLHQLDVSEIDPVKEFGFLVMGHEFDHYPKGMIRNMKNWDWFLEEPKKDDEDEEDFEERRKMGRKRKTCKDNEDEEWSGESEDDKDLVVTIRKGKRPGYSTRSKDSKGSNRDTKANKSSVEEEDDDETLGGFIVADEEDEEDDDDNDEEEEFEEDDDDGVED
ncbi:uncharacterized protein LOC113856641 [Abrus precatorius]|uniref:Uncharacterized protein LOC113856641 n=1 Tax=Abrus precatorius TaxID=3816 RepID=A0A8B8KNP5_ABRPR|nr:uncharacterized protein LOC113856641 [Abrus precatorius]